MRWFPTLVFVFMPFSGVSQAFAEEALKDPQYSAYPKGIRQLKADKAAFDRKRMIESGELVIEPPAKEEAPFDPARGPAMEASYTQEDLTSIRLSVTRPRFFNLDPALLLAKAGTYAPSRLASMYAKYLETHLSVCASECAKIKSVAPQGVRYTSSGTLADSIGDDAFIVSRKVPRTAMDEAGRCTLSPSGSKTGRVVYLSPELTMDFEVTLSGAKKGATAQISFPGLIDSFGGAPSGVGVIEEEGGDILCRGSWSGRIRPPELISLVSTLVADPAPPPPKPKKPAAPKKVPQKPAPSKAAAPAIKVEATKPAEKADTNKPAEKAALPTPIEAPDQKPAPAPTQ